MPVYRDPDPTLTQEWIDSLDALIDTEGPERTGRLLQAVLGRARARGLGPGPGVTTDYRNTIEPADEPVFLGDEAIETRIRHYVR